MLGNFSFNLGAERTVFYKSPRYFFQRPLVGFAENANRTFHFTSTQINLCPKLWNMVLLELLFENTCSCSSLYAFLAGPHSNTSHITSACNRRTAKGGSKVFEVSSAISVLQSSSGGATLLHLRSCGSSYNPYNLETTRKGISAENLPCETTSSYRPSSPIAIWGQTRYAVGSQSYLLLLPCSLAFSLDLGFDLLCNSYADQLHC